MPPKPSAAISPVSPAMQRTVPGTSNRRACGRTCSTSQTAAAIVPTIPIGTLNQNTVRQPKLVSQPPRIGPRTWPDPDDHRVDAERAAELAPRERVRHERGGVRHQQRAADALEDPAADQQEIRRREAHSRGAIVNTANPRV